MPASSPVWEKLVQQKHFVGLKNATVAFMVLILLFSIILIGVGSGGIQTLNTYEDLRVVSLPIGVIVLGLFLLLSTILGLIGIHKQNAKVFSAYLFFLFLLIICQLGVGGAGYTWRARIPDLLTDTWKLQATDKERNSIQSYFQCCGWWNSSMDVGSNCNSSRWYNNNNTAASSGAVSSYSTTGGATAIMSSIASSSTPTSVVTASSYVSSSIAATSAASVASTVGSSSAATPTSAPTSAASVGSSSAAAQSSSAAAQSSSAPAAPSSQNRKRQEETQTNDQYTTGVHIPTSADPPCGPILIDGMLNTLYYVSAVELAFAIIQLVGLIVGLALAFWVLAQASKQRFNRLDDEGGERFTREEFKGDQSDDDDDGEPGKRKIVVNFGN